MVSYAHITPANCSGLRVASVGSGRPAPGRRAPWEPGWGPHPGIKGGVMSSSRRMPRAALPGRRPGSPAPRAQTLSPRRVPGRGGGPARALQAGERPRSPGGLRREGTERRDPLAPGRGRCDRRAVRRRQPGVPDRLRRAPGDLGLQPARPQSPVGRLPPRHPGSLPSLLRRVASAAQSGADCAGALRHRPRPAQSRVRAPRPAPPRPRPGPPRHQGLRPSPGSGA